MGGSARRRGGLPGERDLGLRGRRAAWPRVAVPGRRRRRVRRGPVALGPPDGLVAAAVLCFAFLPVAFSRLALTDVGALLPVALVPAVLRAPGRDAARLRWCAWAGAAVGAAVGFKYTAGLVVLVPLTGAGAAAARRATVSARRRLLAGAAVVVGASVVVLLRHDAVRLPRLLAPPMHQLRGQADVAGERTKSARPATAARCTTPGSLTWGARVAGAAAAAAGAVLLARRERARRARCCSSSRSRCSST